MNFTQALNKLQNGKLVKRPAWSAMYIMMPYGMQYMWKVTLANESTNPYLKYSPSNDDMMSDDWELVE